MTKFLKGSTSYSLILGLCFDLQNGGKVYTGGITDGITILIGS